MGQASYSHKYYDREGNEIGVMEYLSLIAPALEAEKQLRAQLNGTAAAGYKPPANSLTKHFDGTTTRYYDYSGNEITKAQYDVLLNSPPPTGGSQSQTQQVQSGGSQSQLQQVQSLSDSFNSISSTEDLQRLLGEFEAARAQSTAANEQRYSQLIGRQQVGTDAQGNPIYQNRGDLYSYPEIAAQTQQQYLTPGQNMMQSLYGNALTGQAAQNLYGTQAQNIANQTGTLRGEYGALGQTRAAQGQQLLGGYDTGYQTLYGPQGVYQNLAGQYTGAGGLAAQQGAANQALQQGYATGSGNLQTGYGGLSNQYGTTAAQRGTAGETLAGLYGTAADNVFGTSGLYGQSLAGYGTRSGTATTGGKAATDALQASNAQALTGQQAAATGAGNVAELVSSDLSGVNAGYGNLMADQEARLQQATGQYGTTAANVTAALGNLASGYRNLTADQAAQLNAITGGYQSLQGADAETRAALANQYGQYSTDAGQRLARAVGGYGSLKDEVLNTLAGQGQQAAQDIGQRYAIERSTQEQELARRGLGNSTVLSAVGRGLTDAESQEQRRLQEELAAQRAEYIAILGGEQASAGERAATALNAAQLEALGYGERSEATGLQTGYQTLAAQQAAQQQLANLGLADLSSSQAAIDTYGKYGLEQGAAAERVAQALAGLGTTQLSAEQQAAALRGQYGLEATGAQERMAAMQGQLGSNYASALQQALATSLGVSGEEAAALAAAAQQRLGWSGQQLGSREQTLAAQTALQQAGLEQQALGLQQQSQWGLAGLGAQQQGQQYGMGLQQEGLNWLGQGAGQQAGWLGNQLGAQQQTISDQQAIALANLGLGQTGLGLQSDWANQGLNAYMTAYDQQNQLGSLYANYLANTGQIMSGLWGQAPAVIERRTDVAPSLADIANLSTSIGQAAADRQFLNSMTPQTMFQATNPYLQTNLGTTANKKYQI